MIREFPACADGHLLAIGTLHFGQLRGIPAAAQCLDQQNAGVELPTHQTIARTPINIDALQVPGLPGVLPSELLLFGLGLENAAPPDCPQPVVWAS